MRQEPPQQAPTAVAPVPTVDELWQAALATDAQRRVFDNDDLERQLDAILGPRPDRLPKRQAASGNGLNSTAASGVGAAGEQAPPRAFAPPRHGAQPTPVASPIPATSTGAAAQQLAPPRTPNPASVHDVASALVKESKPSKASKQRAPQPARSKPAKTVTTQRRDWRWVVGGLGRILISLGLLIFAFVAYQLWGTGIQYAQEQGKLRSEFEQLLVVAPAAAAPAPPAPSTTAAPTPDPAVTVAADPALSTPAAPPTPEPAAVPVAPPLPAIDLGDPIAYLEIPAISLDDVLVAGVRNEDLAKGVGHFPFSPLPGQPGNAALAGHRTTHGQPFFNIDKLVNGDQIIFTTLQGRYVYRVTGQMIVQPSDGYVVANQPDKKMLTLTSCNPKFSARERIVVTADLDEEISSPLAVATSNYQPLAADGSALPLPGSQPTDDPLASLEDPETDGSAQPLPGAEAPADSLVSPADPAVADGDVTGSSQPAGAPDGSSVPSADPNAEDSLDLGSELDATEAEAAQALEAGWFSDRDAWPQVAMWGAAVTAIALAAWRLSKLTRRNWIGALVFIAPFVIVLYFFFENVNRLLPPNL